MCFFLLSSSSSLTRKASSVTTSHFQQLINPVATPKKVRERERKRCFKKFSVNGSHCLVEREAVFFGPLYGNRIKIKFQITSYCYSVCVIVDVVAVCGEYHFLIEVISIGCFFVGTQIIIISLNSNNVT
jgi:hypothetical protein